MTAPAETRREKIVRFVQMSVAIGLIVGLISVALRWGTLSALPAGEMAGTIAGNLIASIPFGMILTAIGWGIAAAIAKLRGN
jgi:uncharacterized membrane protein YagU involved in acid resistance